jgi:hypothetical protein
LDPNRAIYIDFESLRQDPPRPGLLGVLVAGENGGFEQLVVDQGLAGAARAKSHCRAITFADAIAEIVKSAKVEERAIVGWSLFERSVIEKADLPSALKTAFTDSYVNGLRIAARWKSVLHPDLKLPKDNRFDPRNRLDRFAELTRYPNVSGLRGKPADWLRRVIERMAANDGCYRRLKPGAKGAWHRLLVYNEHDCRALAHIVQKAAFELEKWREYERTRFCVFDDPRPQFCFAVGSRNSKLERLLERHNVDRWAFITAWNPASVELSGEENERRQTELRACLSEYVILPGEGVGADPSWQPEPSLLVLGIHRKDAVGLGRKFGQLAIVAGHRGFPARLLPCSPLPTPSWMRKRRSAEAGTPATAQ